METSFAPSQNNGLQKSRKQDGEGVLSAEEIVGLVKDCGGGEGIRKQLAVGPTAQDQTVVFEALDMEKKKLVFDFLMRVHDQHEAKIAHYDKLRQGILQFAAAAFGGLFALAFALNRLSGALPVSILMIVLTVTLLFNDRYYHGITHRAAFEKDYVRIKLNQLLNAADGSSLSFRACGALPVTNDELVPPDHSSHASRYFMLLIGGGVLSMLFFIIRSLTPWLR